MNPLYKIVESFNILYLVYNYIFDAFFKLKQISYSFLYYFLLIIESIYSIIANEYM